MTKISDLLAQLKITSSLSEARRLLNQGAVRIDGTRYLDNEDVAPGDHTLRVGSKVQPFTIPYDVPEDSLDNALNRLAKHIENGELLASTDPITFLNMVEEKLAKLETAPDADFLARQIVDDLFRAGVDARFQQHVVEQTIRAWLAGSGRSWGR